jgi:integrase
MGNFLGNPIWASSQREELPRMARKTNQLTDRQIRTLERKNRTYRLADGNGLYLEIPPKQALRWRLRYFIEGKEKMLSLGTYPEVSLKEAREKAQEARKLIAQRIDPAQKRKADKEEARAKEIEEQTRQANSFQQIAKDYIEHYRHQKAPSYWPKVERAFERDVFPLIGHLPIDEISTEQIITIAKGIEARGSGETARRVHSQIGRVFKYAVANGRAKRNTAADIELSMILKPVKEKHYPAITDPEEFRELISTIRNYKGSSPITRYALSLLALTAVRPGNIREARWEEFDLDAALWRIPGEKMKARKDHLIPLSAQAITLLKELRELTGGFDHLFPSPVHLTQPISDGTMNKALKIMGYGAPRFTPHGFRSSFSTIAREIGGFPHEVIETQLAHATGSEVSRAYNRAQYIEQRRELMQWWADFQEETTKKDTKPKKAD